MSSVTRRMTYHPLNGHGYGYVIKMPLGTDVDLGPGHIMFDGNPAPPGKGTAPPLSFWPMSVVAKRSPISATAELLLNFAVCRDFQNGGRLPFWFCCAYVWTTHKEYVLDLYRSAKFG